MEEVWLRVRRSSSSPSPANAGAQSFPPLASACGPRFAFPTPGSIPQRLDEVAGVIPESQVPRASSGESRWNVGVMEASVPGLVELEVPSARPNMSHQVGMLRRTSNLQADFFEPRGSF